jgi:hypothetical protein
MNDDSFDVEKVEDSLLRLNSTLLELSSFDLSLSMHLQGMIILIIRRMPDGVGGVGTNLRNLPHLVFCWN